MISPGGVDFIGEHTGYSYGHVPPMATDLHTRHDATPAEDVTLRSATIDDQRTFEKPDT